MRDQPDRLADAWGVVWEEHERDRRGVHFTVPGPRVVPASSLARCTRPTTQKEAATRVSAGDGPFMLVRPKGLEPLTF